MVNGQIISDPEGDYTFKEALQLVATQRGASPDEANSLAVALSKQSLDTINVLMPLFSKEPPTQDNTMVLALQQRIEQLADDKHKAEIEALRVEFKGGQRSPESDQLIQKLTQDLGTLKEDLHNQQLVNLQEQNRAMVDKLQDQINILAQGKRTEGSLGFMSEALGFAKEEVSGLRGDVKTVVETIFKAGGPGPTPKTAEDKKKIAAAGKAAVETERRAQAMEDSILAK
ncbi:hypothetical protein ES707_15677 [subsurface metagenome]